MAYFILPMHKFLCGMLPACPAFWQWDKNGIIYKAHTSELHFQWYLPSKEPHNVLSICQLDDKNSTSPHVHAYSAMATSFLFQQVHRMPLQTHLESQVPIRFLLPPPSTSLERRACSVLSRWKLVLSSRQCYALVLCVITSSHVSNHAKFYQLLTFRQCDKCH